MAQKFLTDIELTRGLKDSSGDLGNSGQVLSSTGSALNWINANSAASVVYQDGFTGNGSATAFTLANSIDNENKTQVYIDGVYQHKDTYSLSGTTLTFSTAPPNSSDIEVISFSSVSSADDILYDTDFASAGLMKTNGSGTYSIVTDNSSNWNTAYTYSQVGHLPLAGGTLTGGLTGTTGTFSGNLIVGTNGSIFAENNLRFKSSGAAYIDHNTTGQSINFRVSNSSALDTTPLTIGSNGLSTFNGDIIANGNFLNVAQYIIHINDGDTYHRFLDDRQMFVAGNIEFIDFAETTQNYITIGGSSDIDTRMQGGSGYIFIQGSNGYIGINDASPSYPFEVSGNTNIGGELHVRNVIYGYAGTGNQIGGVSWTSTDSGFLFAKTGNVTKVLLNSNGNSYLNGGNVGIGTSSPIDKLNLHGGSTDNLGIQFNSDAAGSGGGNGFRVGMNGTHSFMWNFRNTPLAFATNGSEKMTLLANGNLGIGTTNPLFGLSMAQGTGDGNRIGWNDGGGAKRASIICSSSTDALQFHTGTSDAERMRIDSGGDVLMGNTVVNPASGFASQRGFGYDNSTGNVQIAATSGNALTVGRNESSDGAIMTLRKESNVKHSFGSTTSYLLGNVGIGTTSPGYKLHVSGTGGTRMSITNTDTNWAALQIQAKDNQADYIFFKDDTEERARIIAFDSSDLVFSNTDSATERMRITSAGNIGIGTTSPSAKLHVNGVITANDAIQIQGDDSGFVCKNAAGTVIGTIGAASSSITNIGVFTVRNNGNNRIVLHADGSSYFNGGNVGIGTTSPSANLHVQDTSTATLKVITTGVADASVNIQGYDAGVHIGDATNGLRWAIWNDGPSTSSSLKFGSYALGTWYNNSSQVVTMTSDGKVGIKETAPAAKLQVSGDRDGTSEYVAILGEDGGATGAANSASTSPVHKTLITGYGIPYSGQSNARLTTVGFLEFDSTPGWTGNQRNWALTSGYDMGGTNGPKFAILMGDAQNVEPQLGTNGAVGTGDGANTRVAAYWKNTGDMVLPEGSLTVNDGVYVGGSAAANKLDDYEEGTWTPQIYYQNSTDQANATNVVQQGKYTKIGNLVFVQFRLDFSQSSSSPANDNIGVKNLPFAGANNHYAGGGNMITSDSSSNGYNFALPNAGSTIAVLNNSGNIGNYGDQFGSGSGKYIRGSFTYMAQ